MLDIYPCCLIGGSQDGFAKGKLCLGKLVYSVDRVTGLLDKGKAADIIYLDLCNAFDTVPCATPISQLERRGLDG